MSSISSTMSDDNIYPSSLMDSSFMEQFHHHVLQFPDRRCYVWLDDNGLESEVLTYSQLWTDCVSLAKQLQSQQLVKVNDYVVVLYSFSLSFIRSFLACVMIGAIPAPVYPVSPNQAVRAIVKLQAVIDVCKATVILTGSDIMQYRNLTLHTTAWPKVNYINTEELLDRSETVDITLKPTEFHGLKRMKVIKDNLFFIQFTSGSTSEPKGVMVTHSNLLHNVSCMKPHMKELAELNKTRLGMVVPHPIIVSFLPPYHDFGLVVCYLGQLFMGGTGYYMSPLAFLAKPSLFITALSRYKATLTAAPNFALEICRNRIAEQELQEGNIDLTHLQLLAVAADVIRRETLLGFLEKFSKFGLSSTAIDPCYGLAENVVGVTKRPIRELSGFTWAKNFPNLISLGADWHTNQVDLRIVNPNNSSEVKEGERGEIWLKSPSTAIGYLNQVELTEKIFRARLLGSDGNPVNDIFYLRTGDEGFVENGHLFVTGRIKDMIIVKGEKFYPQDIEFCLNDLPIIRQGCIVAFCCTTSELLNAREQKKIQFSSPYQTVPDKYFEHMDHVVIITETKTPVLETEIPNIANTIISTVKSRVGILASIVVFAPKHTVPKTGSGKVQRSEAKQSWLEGKMPHISVKSSCFKFPIDVDALDIKHTEPSNVHNSVNTTDNSSSNGIEANPYLVMIAQGVADLFTKTLKLPRGTIKIDDNLFESGATSEAFMIVKSEIIKFINANKAALTVVGKINSDFTISEFYQCTTPKHVASMILCHPIRSKVSQEVSDDSVNIVKSPIIKSDVADVVIVGAGVSGLSAAYELEKLGYSVVVLEEKAQVGGKTESIVIDGKPYDLGAIVVIESPATYKATRSLMKELNVELGPNFFSAQVNFTSRGILTTDIDILQQKNQEKLLNLLKSDIPQLMEDNGFHNLFNFDEESKTIGAWESAIDYFKDRGILDLIDSWAAREFSVSGYGPLDDKDLSAFHVLKFCLAVGLIDENRLKQSEGVGTKRVPTRLVNGGYNQLAFALQKVLKHVHCNVNIASIIRHSNNSNNNISNKEADKSYTVVNAMQNGQSFSVKCSKLILACGKSAAMNIVNDLDPKERNILSRIVSYNYVSCLLSLSETVPDYNAGVMYEFRDKMSANNFGHIVSYLQPYPNSNVVLVYLYKLPQHSEKEMLELVQQNLHYLHSGATITKIHAVRIWPDYSPHFRVEDVKNGAYIQMNELQGYNDTFWLGGLFNAETVEGNISFSQSLIKRYFQPDHQASTGPVIQLPQTKDAIPIDSVQKDHSNASTDSNICTKLVDSGRPEAYITSFGTATPPLVETAHLIKVASEALRAAGRDENTVESLHNLCLGSQIRSRGMSLAKYHQNYETAATNFVGKLASKPYPFEQLNDGAKTLTADQRQSIWEAVAYKLILEASTNALNNWENGDATKVTHILTTSTSGWKEPGLASYLIHNLGLPLTCQKAELNFNGCFCGMTLLRLARDIIRAGENNESRAVLVAGVELASLHLDETAEDFSSLVAASLFSDGAAAFIVNTKGEWKFTSAGMSLVPNSEALLGLAPPPKNQHAYKMTLRSEVPGALQNYFTNGDGKGLVKSILEKLNIKDSADLPALAIHPGGPRILDAILTPLTTLFHFKKDCLDHSYQTLHKYGNLGSIAILFVLSRVLASTKQEKLVSMAFGPGVTVEWGTFIKTTNTQTVNKSSNI